MWYSPNYQTYEETGKCKPFSWTEANFKGKQRLVLTDENLKAVITKLNVKRKGKENAHSEWKFSRETQDIKKY